MTRYGIVDIDAQGWGTFTCFANEVQIWVKILEGGSPSFDAESVSDSCSFPIVTNKVNSSSQIPNEKLLFLVLKLGSHCARLFNLLFLPLFLPMFS